MSMDRLTLPGIAFGMLGLTSRRPTVADHVAADLARDLADAADHLGRRHQRVVADAHRRRPRVILDAVERQP